MNDSEIDFAAVFQALPGAVALFTPRLEYLHVNAAYLRLSGRRTDQLVGHYVFDVFPDNPRNGDTSGVDDLRASLNRVLDTGERDSMALNRYDVQPVDRPGVFEERYWSTVNTPVHDAEGKLTMIVHRVEEVTELVKARARADNSNDSDQTRVLEADLYTRSRELQELNERLRQAHAREREVALALQAALLPTLYGGAHRAAVRYEPAVGALHVCGDWYDLVDLPDGNMAVAVGDVVGHGLRAACVMGQLRSALSAASRVAEGPAQALEALGLYSRSIDGAESTTAVMALIDWSTLTLTYSSAGHPPPALLSADGTVRFLEDATDPPLGARPEHLPRIEASTAFDVGSTLVLYTDGLIERRREDIDTGLARLADSLVRHQGADPEKLADALLAELLQDGGDSDDTALVILRL
ncbi:SpoIIE family protein phosphatase [Streptomyces sp. NPDC051976]|uniref:PP2C family protein-serine/threonine phosphatase n=1 Tax=Streptomyces sp. NPDC051976 TaxID=3154947 RepID=UPI003447D25C